jgi:hypothetical protein
LISALRLPFHRRLVSSAYYHLPRIRLASFPVPLETGNICTPVRWVGLDYSDGPGASIHIIRACITESSRRRSRADNPHPPPRVLFIRSCSSGTRAFELTSNLDEINIERIMFSKLVIHQSLSLCLSCAAAAVWLCTALEALINAVHDLIKPIHVFRQFRLPDPVRRRISQQQLKIIVKLDVEIELARLTFPSRS